jgi:hypothetical protein
MGYRRRDRCRPNRRRPHSCQILATHHDGPDATEHLLQDGPVLIGRRVEHPVVQHPCTVAGWVLVSNWKVQGLSRHGWGAWLAAAWRARWTPRACRRHLWITGPCTVAVECTLDVSRHSKVKSVEPRARSQDWEGGGESPRSSRPSSAGPGRSAGRNRVRSAPHPASRGRS